MPLSRYLAVTKSKIFDFLDNEHKNLLYISVEAENIDPLLELISSVDDHPHNADLFFGSEHAFTEKSTFISAFCSQIEEECLPLIQEEDHAFLKDLLDSNYYENSSTPVSVLTRHLDKLKIALGETFRHFALVHCKREGWQDEGFHQVVAELGEQLTEPIKLILIGPPNAPAIAHWLHLERVQHLPFQMGADTIQEGLQEALKNKTHPSKERASFLAMSAGFAKTRGELDTAESQASEAYTYWTEIGDDTQAATAALLLGQIYDQLKQWAQSRAWYQESVQHALKADASSLISFSLFSAGETFTKEGHSKNASTCYEHSANWAKITGNKEGQAMALDALGQALQSSKQYEPAQKAWQEALNIYEELDQQSPGSVVEELEQAQQRLGGHHGS